MTPPSEPPVPVDCPGKPVGEELEDFVEVDHAESLFGPSSVAETMSETSDTCGDLSDGSEKSQNPCTDECTPEPEDYRGAMVKPLSLFGTFDIDPEVRELKWISDHTSGEVHKDTPTISMLYNQDLDLPEAAQRFIAQSPELLEEARWERLKAAFYGFYPSEIQHQAYQILSELSVLEASRIIAKITSRFANEVILKPFDDACGEGDVEKLKEEIPGMIEEVLKVITDACVKLNWRVMSLTRYVKYKGKCDFMTATDIKSQSKAWNYLIEDCQTSYKIFLENRVLLFQLSHAQVRFEPRTQWIHIRTQPFFPDSKETDSLPEDISGFPLLENHTITGEAESMNAAMASQIETFENGLSQFGTGAFINFDSKYHNGSFERYDCQIPYAKISPNYWVEVLRIHCEGLPSDTIRRIVPSRPVISRIPKRFHEIQAYFKFSSSSRPYSSIHKLGSKLTPNDGYGFCMNCFSESHRRVSCNKPKYGFGCPKKNGGG
ncbi:hypothetical protein JCM33374_g425 [Metschnikowia sp. JCM 33374]|nr:hypothetical protein JCM33374_g425 [Metschnikowia sp. JCM 33374]